MAELLLDQAQIKQSALSIHMKNDSTTALSCKPSNSTELQSPPNNEHKQPLGCKPSARCNRHHTPPTGAQAHTSKHQQISMVPTGAQSSCPHTAAAPVQVILAFIILCLLTTSATSGVVRVSQNISFKCNPNSLIKAHRPSVGKVQTFTTVPSCVKACTRLLNPMTTEVFCKFLSLRLHWKTHPCVLQRPHLSPAPWYPDNP